MPVYFQSGGIMVEWFLVKNNGFRAFVAGKHCKYQCFKKIFAPNSPSHGYPFWSSIFLGGGVGFFQMENIQIKKTSSIHAGSQGFPHCFTASPCWVPRTEGRPSEHQELMLTILTVRNNQRSVRSQQEKRENQKKHTNSMAPRKSDVCFWYGSNFVLYICFYMLLISSNVYGSDMLWIWVYKRWSLRRNNNCSII